MNIQIFELLDKHFLKSNCKYYCIKLAFDTLIQKNTYCKNIFKKYGTSQLLYSFYTVTLINNMFHSKKNINQKYRKFLCSFGVEGFTSDFEIPFQYTYQCYLHKYPTLCSEHTTQITIKNIQKLFLLYSKIYFTLLIIQTKINKQLIQTIESILRSTFMLSSHCFIYRTLLCFLKNKKNYATIIDSQTACLFGSFAFLIENDSRKKIINKYLSALYLDSVTSQFGIEHEKYIVYIFFVLFATSFYHRGLLKTCISLIG